MRRHQWPLPWGPRRASPPAMPGTQRAQPAPATFAEAFLDRVQCAPRAGGSSASGAHSTGQVAALPPGCCDLTRGDGSPPAVSPDGRRRATLKLTDWVGVRPSRVLVTFGCGKGTPKRAERPGALTGERERPAARPVDPNRRIGSARRSRACAHSPAPGRGWLGGSVAYSRGRGPVARCLDPRA
jgi:hypothetical protein